MLLEALLKHGAPMRPGDIARLIHAPRSTTYEIVARLVEAELLEQIGGDGSVFFGRAMHLYGHAFGRHDAVYKRIAETLERLAADARATAQVCTLKGNKYIVFDCRNGPGPFRITSDVGVEVPIPWTASGRLLLSHMTNGDIRAFIPPEDYRLPDGRTVSQDRSLPRSPWRGRRDFANARTRRPLHAMHGRADTRPQRRHRQDPLSRSSGRDALIPGELSCARCSASVRELSRRTGRSLVGVETGAPAPGAVTVHREPASAQPLPPQATSASDEIWSSRLSTTSDGRGGMPSTKSGQLVPASAMLVASSPSSGASSPGCWTEMNMRRPSGVKVGEQTSEPTGGR